MHYTIAPFTISDEAYRPGDRVMVESVDYGNEEGTFAGIVETTLGTCIVVDVDGEHVVLSASDVVSIVKVAA